MYHYLREYYEDISITDPFAAPHYYRSRVVIKQNRENEVLKTWEKNEEIVIEAFLKKVQEIIQHTERFYIFCVPTNNNRFVSGIIQRLATTFNSIDATKCFKKNAQVQFGSEEFSNVPIEELLKYIDVNNEQIEKIKDNNITSALIVDDVYQSGKSIRVLELLLSQYFPKSTNINKCVILKMPPSAEVNIQLGEEINDKVLELNYFYYLKKFEPGCIDIRMEIIKREEELRILRRKFRIGNVE